MVTKLSPERKQEIEADISRRLEAEFIDEPWTLMSVHKIREFAMRIVIREYPEVRMFDLTKKRGDYVFKIMAG